jgi:rhodanese-related sulfurtransferase
MGKITEILNVAQQRAKELNLPYQGAVTPQEAYELLKKAPGAKIVDVRTRAEIDWVGRVPGAVEIEWLTYPGMKQNPNFVAALQQQVDKEALVLFLCRSAHRSHFAAAAADASRIQRLLQHPRGFRRQRTRATPQRRNGWRLAGLPQNRG